MASRSAAYDRFIASMNIGYMEWHEGTPYDCEALSEVSKDELADLEGLLIGKKDEDWRVSEALATIGSHSALGGTAKSTTGPNREVRIRASELLSRAGLTVDFDGLIVEGLQHGTLGQGLAECERLAAQHPSPAVKDALLDGALRSTDGRAVRFVGILFSCTARPTNRSTGNSVRFSSDSTPTRGKNGVQLSMNCARSLVSTDRM